MSTSYRIVCFTCNPNTQEDDFGTAETARDWGGLEWAVHYADAIADLARNEGTGQDLRVSCVQLNFDFFVRHTGHRLRVRSEYGEFTDECNTWYEKETGESAGNIIYRDAQCRKPKDHPKRKGTDRYDL